MSFALATRRSAFAVGRQMVRYESTTTQKAAGAAKDAASKATSTASEYTAKASETVSRVTAAAGPAISKAAQGVSGALGRVGGRTGRLIAFVERQVPTVLYYSKVGLELSKIVFRSQKMTPPPVNTFQTFFQNVWTSIQNPSTLFRGTNPIQAVRNIGATQVVAGGVLAAECLGFFTVGEMIGRFKIVGYHGEAPAAHH
ncbi:ATP synthase subunit G, mitochondrial [Naviculisporaceae sp. PSN 640]